MSQFPPSAAPGDPSEWMQRVDRRPFSFANAFAQGWAVFTSNYGFTLVAILIISGIMISTTIVVQGVQFVLGVLVGSVGGTGRNAALPMAIVGLIGSVLSLALAILVQWPAQASLAYAAAAAVRKVPANASNLLRGFHRYGRSLKVMGLFSLMFMAIIVPVVFIMVCGGVLMSNAARGGGGANTSAAAMLTFPMMMLVLGLAVSYLSSRFGMAIPLAMDEQVRDLSTVECFKQSWNLTKPRSIELFGLYVVLYLMNVAGLLALCLPMLFFTGPLALSIVGAAYHQLAFESGLFRSPFVCHGCGYPVQPGMPVCPECGTTLGTTLGTAPGAGPSNLGTPPTTA